MIDIAALQMDKHLFENNPFDQIMTNMSSSKQVTVSFCLMQVNVFYIAEPRSIDVYMRQWTGYHTHFQPQSLPEPVIHNYKLDQTSLNVMPAMLAISSRIQCVSSRV